MEVTPSYMAIDQATLIIFQNAMTYGTGLMNNHRIGTARSKMVIGMGFCLTL